MEAILSKEIVIKEPTDELVEWLEKNRNIPNPEFAKKERMGLWTGNTPRTIQLWKQDGDRILMPSGDIGSIYENFEFERIANYRKNPIYIPADFGDKALPLYDYQEKAVEAMENARYGCGILQSPAGSGKTQMAIEFIRRLKMRTLWVTHTEDLLKQSKTRFEAYLDKSLVGTITGGKVNVSTGITFATVQTLSKLDLSEYTNTWDLVIVDECHRVAGSPSKVTMFYKVLSSLNAYKFGLSATLHRSDGLMQCCYSLIGPKVYEVPEEAVKEKVEQVTVQPVYLPTELSEDSLNPDGTICFSKMITNLGKDFKRNLMLMKVIMANSKYSSLILSDRLEHLEALMDLLPPSMKENAVMISGKMNSKKGKEERALAIEHMKSGEKKYLFATYSLAKEGLDIPRLERLYLTTPQKDYAIITQSVGRIARKFEGKASPVCFDFVDEFSYGKSAWRKRKSIYRRGKCLINGE